MYGGSYDTVRPSFEYGGSTTNFNYFVDGSYDHNALGIENPTRQPQRDPRRHGSGEAVLLSVLDSGRHQPRELHGQRVLQQLRGAEHAGPAIAGNALHRNGNPWLPGNFDSSTLNEQQREQNYYGVVTYQKSVGDFNGQISVFGRSSGVHFRPDQIGDLYFNGVASDVERKLYLRRLAGRRQLRAGRQTHDSRRRACCWTKWFLPTSTTTVFPVDARTGNPNRPAGDSIRSRTTTGCTALFAGVYLQDEWKIFAKFTVNYGARFDVFNSSFDNECQLSPRVNLI